MRRSAYSDSGSTKWSEPIVVVGKGFPNWSSIYRCLTQCIAGLSKKQGWVRLYPVLVKPIFGTVTPVENFDIIRTVFRRERPESRPRAESRKILPERMMKVGSLDETERVRLLISKTEDGKFLHDDSWEGKKTLGLVKPDVDRLLVDSDNYPMVKFHCGYKKCGGHSSQLLELVETDAMGRCYPQKQVARERVEQRLRQLCNSEVRFVMGTHSQHRHRWMIVTTHRL